MARTTHAKLTATQAIPLLDEAIRVGDFYGVYSEMSDSDVLEWVRHTSIVLESVEGIAPTTVRAFELEGDISRRQTEWMLSGREPNEYGLRNETAKKATAILEVQLKILRIKTGGVTLQEATPESPRSVFIGHGRNPAWLELQRFIEKRLRLEVAEFNSVSTAGTTIIDRLKVLLQTVGFAFIIMTGEDDLGNGSVRARQNVIHEIGLFQGRLGFDKAIILLEAGCDKFSNIDGLIYISFPKGNIDAAFEKIRATLESAGLMKGVI